MIVFLMTSYSILGVIYFADIDPKHFGSVIPAVYTMWQVMTLEGWPNIANRVMPGGYWYNSLFFVSFIILTYYLLLNMLVAIFIYKMKDARTLIKEEDEQDIMLAQRNFLLRNALLKLDQVDNNSQSSISNAQAVASLRQQLSNIDYMDTHRVDKDIINKRDIVTNVVVDIKSYMDRHYRPMISKIIKYQEMLHGDDLQKMGMLISTIEYDSDSTGNSEHGEAFPDVPGEDMFMQTTDAGGRDEHMEMKVDLSTEMGVGDTTLRKSIELRDSVC